MVDELTTRFGNDKGIGVAYIYCNFRRQDEQKVGDLLPNLLRQLVQGQQALPEDVRLLYDKHKHKHTRLSFDESLKALYSVTTSYSKVFIVVDALDECQASDGCRSRFLSEIFLLQSKCGVNFFATSRFIPAIMSEFSKSLSGEIRASDEDVRRYLEGHIRQLPSFVERNRLLQEEIKNKISEAVDGMFLLAQIYLSSLSDKPTAKSVKNSLKQFRKQNQGSSEAQKLEVLGHAYDEAMERINGQMSGFRDLAMKVLAWITCAKRPLTTSELQHALGVEIGESELDEDNLPQLEDIVSVCAGLITIDEESSIIRLVHYSTQEYFQRTQSQWFPNAEIDIATICVTYLSFDIFESGFCESDSEFEERLQSNKFYDYAAHKWGHHSRKASNVCQEVIDFLKSERKSEAASQGLLAFKRYPEDSYYSLRAPRQMSGLHLAAYFGLHAVINTIISFGQSVNLKNSLGRMPLVYAAGGRYEAVVKLLLEKGAELEPKERYNFTPLLSATVNGHEAVVKLLLEKGAELEIKNSFGCTPVSYAAEYGHEAVIKLLLEKGAKLETRIHFGRRPHSMQHQMVIRQL